MADCVAVAFGGGPANGRHAVIAGGVHRRWTPRELLLESVGDGGGVVVVIDDIVDGRAGGGAL